MWALRYGDTQRVVPQDAKSSTQRQPCRCHYAGQVVRRHSITRSRENLAALTGSARIRQ